jgi:hypothetical protein
VEILNAIDMKKIDASSQEVINSAVTLVFTRNTMSKICYKRNLKRYTQQDKQMESKPTATV